MARLLLIVSHCILDCLWSLLLWVSQSVKGEMQFLASIMHLLAVAFFLSAHNGGFCLALDKQIDLFNRTAQNYLPRHFKQQTGLRRHLHESLFFVSVGVNDHFLNLRHCQEGTKGCLSPKVFGKFLLNELSVRLQKLYDLGARKILVNNIPPAGCFPSELIKMRNKGACNEDTNKMMTYYNRRLPRMLQQLQSQLPGAAFIHSDLFKFISEL